MFYVKSPHIFSHQSHAIPKHKTAGDKTFTRTYTDTLCVCFSDVRYTEVFKRTMTH